MQEILDSQEQDPFVVPEEELRTFFGRSSEYYIQQWIYWTEGQFPGINPFALLFGICWLIYRQLWLSAGGALVFFWFLGLLEKSFLTTLPVAWSSNTGFFLKLVLLHLLIGLFGNRIYLGHAQQQIRHVKSSYSGEEILPELASRGGTSLLPVLIFLILLISVAFSPNLGSTGRSTWPLVLLTKNQHHPCTDPLFYFSLCSARCGSSPKSRPHRKSRKAKALFPN